MAIHERPGLSSPEGLRLARDLLRPQLPHEIHDYILEGICKAIDGQHILSVLPTNGGKTSYIYGYMLLLRALQALPQPAQLLRRHHPRNPAMVAIFPTKGLEIEMESRFNELNLKALAINEDTLRDARLAKRNLWKECIEDISMVFVSPELLNSQSFDRLLKEKAFSARLCALVIDEVHLVQDWGDSSFREAFRHIALVHARMPRGTVMIGLTATLLAGQETTALLKTLGLTPGSFFFQRRSNIRRDVRDIYRILRHGLGGWDFPDLDWIIEGDRKTIVFCGSIALSVRLRVYFHSKNPNKIIRLYNSLCFPNYNTGTRELFVSDPKTQIVIATDCLVVGINFPNVEDVVDLDCKHPNHGKQRKGRVGRGSGVREPRGITYVTKATMDRAQKMVEEGPMSTGVNSGKWQQQGLHYGMAQLLVADCKPRQENILYDNSNSDPECSCSTCCKARANLAAAITKCLCSGPHCSPEPQLPPLSRATPQSTIPMAHRLTDKMIVHGTLKLQEFRTQLWRENFRSLGFQLPAALLPDEKIKAILENFAYIKQAEDLDAYISGLPRVPSHSSRLFSVISELRIAFKAFPADGKKGGKAGIPVDPPTVSVSFDEASAADGQPSYANFWASFNRPVLQPITGQSFTSSGPISTANKRPFEDGSDTPYSPRRTRNQKKRRADKENV